MVDASAGSLGYDGLGKHLMMNLKPSQCHARRGANGLWLAYPRGLERLHGGLRGFPSLNLRKAKYHARPGWLVLCLALTFGGY
jgi:hypothetical protein